MSPISEKLLQRNSIERRSNLSYEEFIEEYEQKGKPVIITDVAKVNYSPTYSMLIFYISPAVRVECTCVSLNHDHFIFLLYTRCPSQWHRHSLTVRLTATKTVSIFKLIENRIGLLRHLGHVKSFYRDLEIDHSRLMSISQVSHTLVALFQLNCATFLCLSLQVHFRITRG